MPKPPDNHPKTRRSRRGYAEWLSTHGGGRCVLERGDYRLIVERVGITQDRNGLDCVEVVAWLHERRGGRWLKLAADPDGHYVFHGPPNGFEDELWDTVLTVASRGHQDMLRASGHRGSSTATFYADTSDGYLYGEASTWAAARNGIDTKSSATDRLSTGRYRSSSYYAREAMLNFDTSGLPDDCSVDSVTISFYGREDADYVGHFTCEIRAHNWGDTLEASDAVQGDDTASKTLLAEFNTSNMAVEAYNTFTSTSAFPGYVSKTGKTRLLLCADLLRWTSAYTTDGWYQYVAFYSADTSGTSKDPKLVVTYTQYVSASVTTEWNVRSDVSRQATMNWNVQCTVGKSADMAWNVRYTVMNDASMRWHVLQGVERTASMAWNVDSTLGTVSKSATVGWNVHALVSKSVTINWNVSSGVFTSITGIRLVAGKYTDLEIMVEAL